MGSKLRQHSLSSVRKLQELLHECNVALATFRGLIQQIGTTADTLQMRRDLDLSCKTCFRSCEAAKNCILPQLKHEGSEFTRYAFPFIGCLSTCVVEMKRCDALERTFRMEDAVPIAAPHITDMEEMLEALENLITVHYSTSECSPESKVTPRRKKSGSCKPQFCSQLKTSYA